ncbi:restriction endonuclease subunit S [Nocardia sp. NPDC004573]|uniref:restriction endonuclease subunit S n=1 Tax=Nocardia sp. NPDC047038 TaxID=3154338 RepID=UPI0033C905CC
MRKSLTLAELSARGDLIFSDGYRTRADQLGTTGLPILRVADVLDGRLEPSYKDHIRLEFRTKMGAKVSRPGDVLITTKGTVGRVARVPDDFPEHSYSPQVCFLRSLNEDALNSTWLYHWARSLEFAGQLGIYKDQTDMAPYVSLTDLRRVVINLPPIEEQERLVAALGALDELIAHNRREIDRAERLSAAIFQRFSAST